MLQVLNAANTRLALTTMAEKSNLPWALLRDAVMEFVEEAREKEKYYFAFADDSETSALIRDKAVQVSFGGGYVTVFVRQDGAQRLAQIAQKKFGLKWKLIELTFKNFLETCYSNNYVLVAADDITVPLLDQKLENGNVKFRLKT